MSAVKDKQQFKKMPSERQFSARYANAVRIAEKLAALLASGHHVFDKAGDRVDSVTEYDRYIAIAFRDSGSVIYFIKDKRMDNGAMDSISAFNALFEGWTYLDPSNIKPLSIRG